MDKEFESIEISIFSKDHEEIKLRLSESNHMKITCEELILKIDEQLNLSNKCNVPIQMVFSLCLVSKYLELPMKDSYKPFGILMCWSDLLKTFSPKFHHLKNEQIEQDQPFLSLQRNMFLDRADEEKIENELVLKLLYEEAKSNVINGRYQLEDEEHNSAIQLQIDYLRTNDERILTTQYFKENCDQYLSSNYLQSSTGTFLTLNRLRATSLDQRVNNIVKSELGNLTLKSLYKDYLKRCSKLAQYGSVFYHGQIEKNLSIFSSLIARNQDLKVWVGVNYDGIHCIDKKTSELMISFVYDDFLWELAVPQSINENQNALPCLFIEINEKQEDRKSVV